jgi:serine/threonine protein kinase
MAQILTCPHGHQWEHSSSAGEPDICPQCGSQHLTLAKLTPETSDNGDPATGNRNSTVSARGRNQTAPEPHPPQIPGYEILELIGSGGMGRVYKARHHPLDRLVALKLIRSDRLDESNFKQRLIREAKLAARLSHPNLVVVHDAGQVDQNPYYTMEYIEGVSLAALLQQRGPLPVGPACEVIRQACLGMQHAHERGLVHRDLKPSNLLLAAADCVVKVVDLGLAFPTTPPEGEAGPLTDSDMMMGTADYMAPEQALDPHKVDIRADVYSLGCTFYHLLAGKAPFAGGTSTQKLLRHQQDSPIPVEQLRLDVTPDLAAVVRRLMARQPEQRFQTPAEAALALQPFAAPIAGLVSETDAPADATTPIASREGVIPLGQTAPCVPTSAWSPPSRSGRKVAMLMTCCLLGLVAIAAIWQAVHRHSATGPANQKTLIVAQHAEGNGAIYPSIRAALEKARPGDRILVQDAVVVETLDLHDGETGRGVVIESKTPSGEPTVWRAPGGEVGNQSLLHLASVEGLRLQGFVLDGENRVEDLVAVAGSCPALRFEDVHWRGFRRSAVRFLGCAGTVEQPVALERLRFSAAGQAQSVLLFESTPGAQGESNRNVQVCDCRFEGPCPAFVDTASPLVDVLFARNRFFQAASAFRCRKGAIDQRQPNVWELRSNTFCGIQTGLRFDALPSASKADRLVVAGNLFARTTTLAKVEKELPRPDQALWICCDDDDPATPLDPAATRCYRRGWVDSSAVVVEAKLVVTCRSEFRVWVNSASLSPGRLGPGCHTFDVTRYFGGQAAKRPYVLAVQCWGKDASQGFQAHLDYNNGAWTRIDTPASWLCWKEGVENWQDPMFNASSWPNVKEAHLIPRELITEQDNVRDQFSKEGNLTLHARVMEWSFLGEDPAREASFLRYSVASPLFKAGPEQTPVGAPPPK